MRLLKEVRNLTENYHVKSGMFHYFRGEFRQAEEFFRKALKDEAELSTADRNNARHYMTLSIMDLGDRLRDQGDLEQAVEQFTRAATISEGFPDIHYKLGGVLEDLGEIDRAIAAYREATRRHPKYLEAFVALGFCLLRAGRVEATVDVFENARQLKAQGIKDPYTLGVEALRSGNKQDAADHFHQAFRSAPQLCDEYRRKALLLLSEEEFEASVTALDRALELCPKYPDLHNFRGIALFESSRFDEAVESFRVSAAFEPGYLVPRLNLAFALVGAGDLQEATAVLESILDETPNEPAALAKLEELRSGHVPEKRRPVKRGTTR